MDYQSRRKIISLQYCRCITLIVYARFKALGSFLRVFHERFLGILTLRIIGKCTRRNLVPQSGFFWIIFTWVFLSRHGHEPTTLWLKFHRV